MAEKGTHAQNAEEGNADRKPLQLRETFMEEENSQKDADQGIDVIAEAGIHNVVMGDSPDEDTPVGGDKEGSGNHEESPLHVGHELSDRIPEFPAFSEKSKNQHHTGEGPQDTVGQDFIGTHSFQQFPVQWQYAPEQVSRKGCQKPFFSFCHRIDLLLLMKAIIPLFPAKRQVVSLWLQRTGLGKGIKKELQ